MGRALGNPLWQGVCVHELGAGGGGCIPVCMHESAHI